jgi:Sec7-like guanine-nucleotide exchange factor
VGQLIGDIDEFAGHIRRHYIGTIRFEGLQIDEGLRVLLRHFTLPGESQVVERIV